MKFIIDCNGTFVGFGFNFWKKEGQNISQFKYILNDGIAVLFFPLLMEKHSVVKNMIKNEEYSLIYCRKIVLVI